MARTVGDFLLARLGEWGVTRLFGYPGDGINGIIAALGRDETIEFVQSHHEEESAFMACGHARFTGEVGVCLATSGPGAIHLLNGLYDAKMDRQPVVAIVGQTARSALGGSYQQEVDLPALFKDVAGEFVQQCVTAAQARHLIDRAMRTAKSLRCVTVVIFPNDVQEADAVETPEHAHGTIHSGTDFSRPRIVPEDADLDRAAALLNGASRVAILAGAGAAGAGPELVEIAERLGAGVAKALLGKMVLPDSLPWVTGQIGLLGTKSSWHLMRECDALLMVGSSFPYSEYLPKEGQAKAVQIDIDPRMLSLRYPMDVALCGDAALTLRALLPRIEARDETHAGHEWRATIERHVADEAREAHERARLPADPVNPELIFAELSDRAPANALFAVDTGMSTTFFARQVKARAGMMMAVSGSLATMGPAISYGIAAKFAFPDRPVIALTGDGAMQMLGLNGLITVAKYWRRWRDPRFITIVLNNRDLNMVTWELRAMGGSPKVPETQDVPEFDYARYAALLGFTGLTVKAPADVVPALEEALAQTKPVVIDFHADPNVVALPPRVPFEQTRNFFAALVKGDADRPAILRQLYRQMTA